MTEETHYIDVNGVRLGYQIRTRKTGKPAALFVHGYSGRSTGDDLYGELLRRLEEEFTIYALDLRGHGSSASQVDGWSMAAVADDVAAFVEALGIGKLFYIGHSFGGFTGMYCEVRHPGTFSAMCLITPGSAEGGKDTPSEIGQLWIDHGNDRDFLVAALNPSGTEGEYPSAHIDAITLIDRRVHEQYFGEYQDVIIIDALSGIEIPVLMLNGGRDDVVPLFTQHATALAIPNCKEVIFSTEGHLFPLEAPERVSREIIAFWRHDCSEAHVAAGRTGT